MIRIRPAEARDTEALDALFCHARAAIALLGIDQWQDGYPEPECIDGDIARGDAYVFESGGALAGYMTAMLDPEPLYDAIDGRWHCEGPYLTVHRMAIDDGFRGRGLSVRMLDFARDFARSHGCASVRADTHRGNRAMRGLLEKCGYLLCGEVRYPVAAGDPVRVAYELPLEEK